MQSLLDQNVIIDGHRIAHGIHGTGEPIVLIHGTPSASFIWRDVLPRLAGAGYQVHLYDLLGFGLSERPWDQKADTSVSGQVPVLFELMDVWGLNDAHIVAHDIGGGIAQRLAVFHQEKVRTLTLIDTVSFDSWPSQRTRRQMEAGLEALISKPDAEHRAHFEEWLLETVANKENICGEPLSVYLEYISGPVGQGSFFQHQVAHYDHRHTSELTPQLSKIGEHPVQLIWGEGDTWQRVEWGRKLQAAIPGSRLHVVPDGGHFLMEDSPQEVAELIHAFIVAND